MAGVPVVACWDGGGVLDVVPPRRGAGRLTLPARKPLATRRWTAARSRRARGQAAGRGRVVAPPACARITVAEVCEGWYREALGG